jgi:uncharacterized iron-regulated membrane protein
MKIDQPMPGENMTNSVPEAQTGWLDHRTVWRWHFYAGLFCIPFVLWLSVTGTVFLFHPQIQHLLDRPYDHLAIDHPATANMQIQAALAAVPGATLDSYQLAHSPSSAIQILVDKGAAQFRVYVHPQSLSILKIENEDHRVDVFTSRLHGELLLGKYGSWIVELAGSWAVIMILTGLFLWWPSHSRRFAGVLYPRLGLRGRAFWKDIHSVVGIYVSFLALFLLLTGLPWAKSWGGYLKAIRHFSATSTAGQGWTTSSAEVVAARQARSSMQGMTMEGGSSGGGHAQHAAVFGRHSTTLTGPEAFQAIDTLVPVVTRLALPEPALISPPMHRGGNWTARSDTRNRPLRVDLVLDGTTGAVLKRDDFHSKPWLDRAIFVGIAAHEGRLFGLANQLVSLFTTVCLVTLSLSGVMMWWKRKPEGVLGAPAATRKVRFSAGLIGAMVALGVYFPFLGVSMIVVAVVERFVLRRLPATQHWLGLHSFPG